MFDFQRLYRRVEPFICRSRPNSPLPQSPAQWAADSLWAWIPQMDKAVRPNLTRPRMIPQEGLIIWRGTLLDCFACCATTIASCVIIDRERNGAENPFWKKLQADLYQHVKPHGIYAASDCRLTMRAPRINAPGWIELTIG